MISMIDEPKSLRSSYVRTVQVQSHHGSSLCTILEFFVLIVLIRHPIYLSGFQIRYRLGRHRLSYSRPDVRFKSQCIIFKNQDYLRTEAETCC